MADVKWIKIKVDVFDDEKISTIETLPDGYSLEIVWFKILCLAGKCNSHGFLMISEKIPYTIEMLSKIFRMEIGVVQRALDIFESLEMIDVVDNVYCISNWDKHQSLDRLEKIRQKDRERKALKKQETKEISDVSTDNSVEFPSENTLYSYSLNSNISNSIKDIVNYLNNKANKKYRIYTPKTRKLIETRMKEGFTVDDFKQVIDTKVEQWSSDKKMQEYLRPETLFGTKFESYLNQNSKSTVTSEPAMSEVAQRLLSKTVDYDLSDEEMKD